MSLKRQEIRTVSASPRGLGEPCTAWRLFLSAWVVLLLLGQAVSARAADGDNSLWASPASLDLTVRAGQAISQEFQVGNDSDVEVKIKAYVWDWWLTDKNKKLFGPPGSPPLIVSSEPFHLREFDIPVYESSGKEGSAGPR